MFKYIAVLIIVSGCSNTTTNYIFKDESKSSNIDISYDVVLEKISNNESFVLYIGRDDCLDCSEFKPILDDYLNNHPGSYIYSLDIKEFYHSDDIEYYEIVKETLDYDWTPSLRFIHEGHIESKYQYLDLDFYELGSATKREEMKVKYINDFQLWMDNIFR